MNKIVHTTPEPALPPQARRPDETLEEHALFLRWWSTSPRPVVENAAVAQIAYRHDWRQRGELLDHRTAPVRPLAEVTRSIALDAVAVLSVELEALAAECRANPGRQRLRDLTPLLTLIASMGGWTGAVATEQESGQIDISLASPDERLVLLKALPILEKIRRAKSAGM